MYKFLKIVLAFFAGNAVWLPAVTLASQTGIPGYTQSSTGSNSCHACHTVEFNSPVNSLILSGSNSVLAGTTSSYTIKLVAPYSQSISYGGFDISSSVGSLISTDSETRISNSELVHSNRKATIDTGSSYEVQWAFDWQAPAIAGSVTLFACGLPVNGDGKSGGGSHHGTKDGRVACSTFDIQVQQPPSAVAGENQTITELNAVTLDGSASNDIDGSITTYLWQQVSGTSATLFNENTDTASFTAPDVPANATDELIFSLTVTDNDGLVDTDTISVFVQDALVTNVAPIANAGSDQNVNETVTVNLDASGSSDDGLIVSYLWEQTAGINAVSLNNASSVTADFSAPAVDSAGDVLTFQLTVTDDLGVASTDTMDVTINDVDTPPTALITDASGVVITAISNNGQVILYGNFSSDPEGPITSYSWLQTAGSPIVNPGPANENSFSFSAPDNQGSSIDIQLTVTGDEGAVQNSITASLILNNLPPIVDAGENATLTEGSVIELHGTVSDANNNLSSVQWRQINCASNCIMLPVNIALPLIANEAHGSIMSPSIVAENSGMLLEFELTAVDADGLTSSSSKQVSINDNGITSFPDNAISFNSFNNRPMAISVESLQPDNTAVLSNLINEANSSVSDNVNRPLSFPYEMTGIEITLVSPGSVLVTLYFPEPVISDFDFYQYMSSYGWINTTKAKNFDDINFNNTNGWSEVSEEVEFSADRMSVTILLTDGGPGDQNPLPNVISSKAGIGENQVTVDTQPGATGAINPLFMLLAFLLTVFLRKLFHNSPDLN